MIVDFAKDEGENKAANYIAERVHIGEDAAGAGEGNGDNHEDFEDDAGGFVLDVVGEDNGGNEENGSNDHNVSGREGWFAGAVGAGGENDEFVEDEISNRH